MGHIKKGELTQEEKELLEVIGKGTGAGLVPRRRAPGRGTWRSLGVRSRPGVSWAMVRNKPFCLRLGTDCRGWEMGGRQKHCGDQIETWTSKSAFWKSTGYHYPSETVRAGPGELASACASLTAVSQDHSGLVVLGSQEGV